MKEASCRTAARRRLLGNERGTATLEFAVVAYVLLFILFGIYEFSRAVWMYSTVAHGAREGVRYAIVRGGASGRAATPDEIKTYVRKRTGLNSLQVITSWQPDNQPGSVVQVQASFAFKPVVPFIPAMTLSSTSRMVISF